jgi:hypothetical protein
VQNSEGSFPFRRGKTRPSSLAESAARRVIGVSGATTQAGRGPHAVREARCALVMVLYYTWKIVLSRNQRYLHIDARTNHPSIHMEMLQRYLYIDACIYI